MTKQKKNQYADITIDTFSKKGNGLGTYTRADDTKCPIEVPFTIPGDKARVIVLRKRKGIHQSLLEEVITPSPDRVIPKCPHFSVCGGCRWQQLPYKKQLIQKEAIVSQVFPGHKIPPMIPSVAEWNYRNKMEFSFSADVQGQQYLGLVMNGGKGRVVNIKTCDLATPWFATTLDVVRHWWSESSLEAFHPRKNTGSLRTLTVREGQRTGDRMINLTVSGNPDFALTKQQVESFVVALRKSIEPDGVDQHLSIFLTIHQAIKGQPTQFFEMHLYGPDHIREKLTIQTEAEGEKNTLAFHVSPQAFFQPNTSQAEVLYSKALQLADIPKQGVVYDLYCGTGTLGICAARHASQVVGIELSREAILDARANAKINNVDNITFYQGMVHEQLEKIRSENLAPPPDLVVVDPPRVGLDPSSIKHLLDFAAPKILYISCNPKTQAENCAELAANGYQIVAIQPVDQFPHTIHIENIVLLKKR